MKKTFQLYIHYVTLTIRSMMQYKTSFFLSVLGQFLVLFTVFLGILVMFQRFNAVDGFTYSEVLLCYAIFLMAFSLAELFARGFDSFSAIVRTGEFDRILVRPQSEILQVLGSRFELTRIGRILQAAVMFVSGVTACGIEWNLVKGFTVLFMWTSTVRVSPR